MASEPELIERLREILRASDLTDTTTSMVRRRLEEDFGVDLSDKKAFVREQVELFIRNEFDDAEEHHHDDDDDDDVREMEQRTNGSDSKEREDKIEEVHQESSSRRKRRSKKHPGGEDSLCKSCRLSPKLQEFIGIPKMTRTEVVNKMWDHISEKNLQDTTDKGKIMCDESLRALFAVDSISILEMNKAVSELIHSADSDKGNKEKRPERGKWGFLAPLRLSDALVNFLATGETLLARSDVIKRLWVYIKENKLQDPTNKKRVICDEKLKELLGVDSFDGFTVTKLLTAHFVKA